MGGTPPSQMIKEYPFRMFYNHVCILDGTDSLDFIIIRTTAELCSFYSLSFCLSVNFGLATDLVTG